MAAAVPRQKHDRLAIERAEAEFVRGIAERTLDAPPFDIGEPVNPIKPAAADDADNPAGHGICLRDNPAERHGSARGGYSAAQPSLRWRFPAVLVHARPDLALGGVKHTARNQQEQDHLEADAVPLVEVLLGR